MFKCGFVLLAALLLVGTGNSQDVVGWLRGVASSVTKNVVFWNGSIFPLAQLDTHSKTVAGGHVVENRNGTEFMVRIVTEFPDKKLALCSGVLIHPKYVLTAAHCLTKKDGSLSSSITTTAGDLRVYRREPTESVKTVEKAHIHKNFDADKRDNDIAVLQLEGTGHELNPGFIKVAKLSRRTSRPQPDEVYMAAGWGIVSDASSDQGKEVQLKTGLFKTISDDSCKTMSVNAIHPERFSDKHSDSKFCVMSTNATTPTCFGEDGGPLLGPKNDTTGQYDTVFAVNAFAEYSHGKKGARICNDALPAGATLVGTYISWIQGVVGDNITLH